MNISLDKIGPAIAFVLIGSIMVVIGATGMIPFGNPQPEIQEAFIKKLLLIIGSILIAGGFALAWFTVIKPTTSKRKNNKQKSTKADKKNGIVSINAKTGGGDFVIGNLDKSTKIELNQPKRTRKN